MGVFGEVQGKRVEFVESGDPGVKLKHKFCPRCGEVYAKQDLAGHCIACGTQLDWCDDDGRYPPPTPPSEPKPPPRAETGPMQFGNDWPGLFLRGDNALHFALTLRALIEHAEKGGATEIELAVVRGLLSDLASVDTRGGGPAAKLRPYYECTHFTAKEMVSVQPMVVPMYVVSRDRKDEIRYVEPGKVHETVEQLRAELVSRETGVEMVVLQAGMAEHGELDNTTGEGAMNGGPLEPVVVLSGPLEACQKLGAQLYRKVLVTPVEG